MAPEGAQDRVRAFAIQAVRGSGVRLAGDEPFVLLVPPAGSGLRTWMAQATARALLTVSRGIKRCSAR